MSTDKKINIVTICGSVRPGNYTSKALALVIDELEKNPDVTVVSIDPSKLDLSLPGAPSESKDFETIQKIVTDATGVVIATPEYHGSYSSVIKLVIDNLGFPSSLAGKPIALLGVAAGRIGAIKATEHLRSVLSHVGSIVLPGPISIAGIQNVFSEDGTIKDTNSEVAIRGVANTVMDYIRGYICPKVCLEEMARK